MKIQSKTRISDIMTSHLVTSYPDMIMTEVSKILDANTFHHLPVIDENDKCVGVISKSDYYQLQDSFTKMNGKQATINNQLFFRSLLASVFRKEHDFTIYVSSFIEKLYKETGNQLDLDDLLMQTKFQGIETLVE